MAADRAGWRDPLTFPRFRAMWLGGLFSWYGDFLTLPALVIICYRLGGETAVGLLFVATTAPLLALLPLGGHLGDRGDRRRHLIALDLVRAALAGLTIVAAQGHLLAIVLLAVAASKAASALYGPGAGGWSPFCSRSTWWRPVARCFRWSPRAPSWWLRRSAPYCSW